jgi:hypothetical protein
MKEELQGKLVDILTSIQTAAGKASDFALEQLPDIAQSYVAYGRAYSMVSLAFFVCVALGSALALRWAVNSKNQDSPGPFFAGLVGGAAGLISLGMTLVSVKGAMLVWFAPKVWLLKEIATLIK